MPGTVATPRGGGGATPRAGLTLLEVVVVLAVLGIGAAIVLPALAPAHREPAMQDVVHAARATAIARAQSLTLRVRSDGRWTLTAPSRDDSTIATGALTAVPEAVVIDLSPMGGCTLRLPVPAGMRGWDVARCAVREGTS